VCVADHVLDLADDFFRRHAQFVLHVRFGCCQKGMDARILRGANGLPGFVDIGFFCPGKTADRWRPADTQGGFDGLVSHFLGDLIDGVQIIGRCGGETGFDHIDTQAG